VEGDLPDLNQYSNQVRSWRVTRDGGAVIINVTAEHRVDDQNSFTTDDEYRVLTDGSLYLRYAIRPSVQAPWIPEAGVILQGPKELDTLRWLGLGPLDAYPNLKMAAIFGLWSGEAGSATAEGTKTGVRWAELLDSAKRGLRVEGSGYVRLESPGQIRVLGVVEGRPSKYRRPDPPSCRLDLAPGTVIRGAFVMTPVEGM
jgi:beta-galactosidase